MPRFDRTGPLGQGSGTGRGLGPCGKGRGFGLGRSASSKDALASLKAREQALEEELDAVRKQKESLEN